MKTKFLKFKKVAAAGLAAATLLLGASCNVMPPKDKSAVVEVSENGYAKISSDALKSVSEDKKQALEKAVSKLVLDDAYYGKYNPYNVTNVSVKYFSVSPYSQFASNIDYVYGNYGVYNEGYEVFGAPSDSEENLAKIRMQVELTVNTNGKESLEEKSLDYIVPSSELVNALNSGEEISSNDMVDLITSATEEKMEAMDNGAGEYEEENIAVAEPFALDSPELANFLLEKTMPYIYENERYKELIENGYKLTISIGPGYFDDAQECRAYVIPVTDDPDEYVVPSFDVENRYLCPARFWYEKGGNTCLYARNHRKENDDYVICFYNLQAVAENSQTGEKLLLGNTVELLTHDLSQETKDLLTQTEINWKNVTENDIKSILATICRADKNVQYFLDSSATWRGVLEGEEWKTTSEGYRKVKGFVSPIDLNTTTDESAIKLAFQIENKLTNGNVVIIDKTMLEEQEIENSK